MRARFARAGCLALVLSGLGLGAAAQDPQSYARVERGRYLATLGDCVACHTVPGGRPYAGGLPLETPFGTILAPNITPDTETGIGLWSDQEFVAALREGRGRHGAHLYPAMPYTAYTRMSPEEALDIRAYLHTIEPVRNKVVANQLPFPFNIRASLIAWNWLNFKEGEYKPDPAKSEEWNRGGELVQGAGHCGACHTPKNLTGGDQDSAFLQGAALQDWYAPNITGDPVKGVGAWSDEDLFRYLHGGANRWTIASGPMAEAVTNSTSKMSDTDLKAVVAYLKDQKPAGGKTAEPLAGDDARMKRGEAIYIDSCAACHTAAGVGAEGLFPRLAGSPLVRADDPTTLIRMVLQGSRGVATQSYPTGPAMPPLAWRLDDDQVASVLTYIRNAWGNAAAPVAEKDVRVLRDRLANAP